MLKEIFLISLLFTLLADFQLSYAFEVEDHWERNEILLKTQECHELEFHLQSIRKWVRSRNEIPAQISLDCARTPHLNQWNIVDLLPSRARRIYGKKPLVMGPNCFNTALVEASALDYQRFTSDIEWSSYLSSSCRQRSPNEAPQSGDLVAIRTRINDTQFFETHGFVWVSEQMGFSKNGKAGNSAPVLQPLSQIKEMYHFNDPLNCTNPAEIPPANCEVFLNYFECPIEKHKFDQAEGPVEELESQLSTITMNGELNLYPDLGFETSNFSWVPEVKLSSIVGQVKMIKYAFNHPIFTSISKGSLVDVGSDLLFDNQPFSKVMGTPLYWAILNDQYEIAKYLIDEGADVKGSLEVGIPLEAAIQERRPSFVKLLLEKGADPSGLDSDGRPFLYFATQLGQLEIVEVLVEKGADPNQETQLGFTPLIIAVWEGHLSIVEELLRRGAKPDYVTSKGYTALAYARESKPSAYKQEIIARLEKAISQPKKRPLSYQR